MKTKSDTMIEWAVIATLMSPLIVVLGALTVMFILSATRAHAQELVVATHYGVSYQGRPLGCSGFGTYNTQDPMTMAVGPSRYASWPCGTIGIAVGPAGSVLVQRRDSCPGCTGPYADYIDLSEAAHDMVCGPVARRCDMVLHRLAEVE